MGALLSLAAACGAVLASLIDFGARGPWRRACIVALAALIFALPGFFTLPPTDRDESRFAQASKQMLESGDLIDIRFQDEARHKKPVGIYWLQAASAAALGGPEKAPIWAYRLPSLTSATLSAILTAALGTLFFGGRVGTLAGIGAASLILLGVEARMGKTDAALLASILAAQYPLARAWIGAPLGRAHLALFWGAVGASVLLKGPIIALALLGPILWIAVFERRLAWLKALRPFPWVLLTLAMAAPWLVAITIKTGGAFFTESLGKDMLGKAAAGQESHGAPPGVYALAFWGTFWPLTGAFLAAAPWLKANFRAPAVMFLIGCAVPLWLMFEAVPTKLPHYVLPAYPALAILAAAAMLDESFAPGRWLTRAAAILWIIPAVALPTAALVLPLVLEGRLVMGAAWVGLPLALAGMAAMLAGRRLDHLGAGFTAALMIYLGVYGATLPSLSTVWVSPRLAAETARLAPIGPVALVGYHEPSAVFLMGTKTRLLGAEAARALLESEPGALVWAPPGFTAEGLESVAEIRGLNYNGGRPVDLVAWRKKAAP